MVTSKLDLDDSRVLLERARNHFAEFRALLYSPEGPGLWQTNEHFDQDTGEWCYYLQMDRHRFIKATPIISDCATNVASALDHIAAAIAKANGHDRLKSLYFPWGFTDSKFHKALTKVVPVFGSDMAAVITDTRTKYRHEVHHVEAAKQISNSGKHWQLMPASGTAHAVALNLPGEGQRIFQIPADSFVNADIFEFHRDFERLPSVPFTIVIGQTISGLDEDLPTSPEAILECSFRFVDGMITAVQEATS